MFRGHFYNNVGANVPKKVKTNKIKISKPNNLVEVTGNANDPTYVNHQEFIESSRKTPKNILDATGVQRG